MTNPMRTMYCRECTSDVPVEELPDGSVLIHCPKCVGECMACDCYLAANCFDSSIRIEVRQPANGREGSASDTKS
jgi:hypothetical protein